MVKRGRSAMNILFLIKDGHVGGLTNHVKVLANGLQHKGHHIVIGTTKGDSTDFFFTQNKLVYFNFNCKNPITMIRNYMALCKVIKKHKIKIIQSENRITSLYASVYCFFHKGVNYLWANHKVPISDGFWARKITKYGRFAIASTTEGKDFLVNNLAIPENKVKIINLGIETNEFVKPLKDEANRLKSENGFAPNDIIILLYGRLTPDKGHMFLLESIKKIDLPQNIKLVFPGSNDDFMQEIKKRAKSMRIDEQIVFPGLIQGREWLSFTNLVVLPSVAEGFPLACLEAFAMNVPVIRTKTGGYIDTSDMCIGVDYGDTKALGELIVEFLNNDVKYKKVVKNAANRIGEYTNHSMIEKYNRLYLKLN